MNHLISFLITGAAALSPTVSNAFCGGQSIEAFLLPDEIAELDRLVAETAYAQGIYWTAERDGKTLQILGTVHIPDPRFAQVIETISPDLQHADALLVEATTEDAAEMQRYLVDNPHLFSFTDGETLPDLLSEAEWAFLTEVLRLRGFPSALAAKFKPWYLTTSLAIPPCAMAQMQGGAAGIDQTVQEIVSSDVPRLPLEPWKETLALLSGPPIEEQIDMLRGTFFGLSPQEVVSHSDAMVVAMIDAYLAGESARTWSLARVSDRLVSDLDPEDYHVLLDEMQEDFIDARNAKWIPVIEATSAVHDSVFVAFGTAHLPGRNGVLSLLAQNGWVLERVR